MFILLFLASFAFAGEPDLKTTQAIAQEITSSEAGLNDLKDLLKIGPRLAGSENSNRSIQWAKAKMQSYGFENIRLQPVTIPKWERGGIESAYLISNSRRQSLTVAALGNSVGTSPEGVEAQVIEVQSINEVKTLGAQVKGKIIFYNRAMNPKEPNTFVAYGMASDQRTQGAAQAARYGAVAVIVRSMTTLIDDPHPHTGIVIYSQGAPKIPAAAISTRDANILSRELKNNPQTKVRLSLSARQLGTTQSFNVMGDIRGRELPNEIVVLGTHLDSWDLSPCAHDSGTGVVHSLEPLRSLKALNLRPRRTLRAVLYTAEEFGGYGGDEYAKQAANSHEKHVAAIESDRGGFSPEGFTVDANQETIERLRFLERHLNIVGAGKFMRGASGTDIEPLKPLGTLVMGLLPVSTHYFDYHHSASDTFDKIDVNELKRGAAAMAILGYSLAED